MLSSGVRVLFLQVHGCGTLAIMVRKGAVVVFGSVVFRKQGRACLGLQGA